MLLVAGGASAAVTLKLANAGPADPEDRTVIAVNLLKNHVEKKTGGSVSIEVFHASQLGNEKEIMEGLKMGTIELGTITTGPIPTIFKPIMVFDIPYLFPSQIVAWDVLDGPFGKKLMEEMRKATGIRTLAISENGYRHFVTSDKQVKSVADMKGLKIRTMENPAHMKMVESLGGAPTPVAFGELYMALSRAWWTGASSPSPSPTTASTTSAEAHHYGRPPLQPNDSLRQRQGVGEAEPGREDSPYEGAQLFNIAQRSISRSRCSRVFRTSPSTA